MMRVRRMERENVTIEFGGGCEEVGIGAFVQTVFGYSTILQEAARTVSPNVAVNVSVRAVRPGCVSVDIGVAAGVIEALKGIVGTLAPMAPEIVSTAAAFLEFKRSLAHHGGAAGAGSRNGSDVSVRTGDGSVVTVSANTYNLYLQSPKSSEACREMFAALDRDPSVASLACKSGDSGFSAVREDFGAMASDTAPVPEKVREVTERDVCLSVVRPNFENSTTKKWSFVRSNGSTLSASVSDGEFIDRLASVSFTRGTVMVVDLRKVQRFDTELNMFMDKPDSYVVTAVKSVSMPGETPTIPGFEDASRG